MTARLTVRLVVGPSIVEFSADVKPNAKSIRAKGNRLLDVISTCVDPVGLGVYVDGEKVTMNPPEFAGFQGG